MILKVHLDVSYSLSRDLRSRSSGNFFLIWKPQDKLPIHLNGAIFTLCHTLKFVTASESEVELGAVFLNAKYSKITRLTVKELVHLQSPTPIHYNNESPA